ncbi:MAG TPA: UvrD-helicase domain-containing protein [Gemmatimonadaceae bacterium]|nr:UvrD-helicase domain-containing protein [Gemmatimonadaceae bacterium]
MTVATVVPAEDVVPSPSQRLAIEAEPGTLLVLAGPGAGKTFCLTERIRFLIERHDYDPARLCAFTFTNKAAGEIAHRLEQNLGAAAHQITRGTIHAFCAQLLRELGSHIGLESGFGIADEEYQIGVLRRVEGPRPRAWHRGALSRFSAHRFRNAPLKHEDVILLDGYERFLEKRNVLDFDTLVIRTAELLDNEEAAALARPRWDVILVDEFQDLNPVQYSIVRALARDHRHVFAVGDDEQSIYSWAGADPRVFHMFISDFAITAPVHLEENRRCPCDVFELARRLVSVNAPLFESREAPRADRVSQFPVRAIGFETEAEESAWIIGDVQSDRARGGHRWGEVALLYRKHEIGERLEAAFLNAGIPCRLAQGRALADDPVVAYVLAAAKAIARPGDDVIRDEFFRAVLPKTICDEAAAVAGHRASLWDQLIHLGTQLPRADDRVRQIRRARANWRNLLALGRQHATLASLVQDLLSRKVGRAPSVLDERQEEITDPASNPEVMQLAARLRNARSARRQVWIAPMSGADVAIKGMLAELGISAVRGPTPPAGADRIDPHDASSLGVALGVFKAAQLIEMGEETGGFTSFTAIDLETTDKDVRKAEIVEVAAVRVRDGRIAGTFASLVRPRGPVSPEATQRAHGLTDADLVNAQPFEEVWPELKAFCGEDVLVAHNGYEFDFPVLRRLVHALGEPFNATMYDSLPIARELFPTSRRLGDLARHFGIELSEAHRALPDTEALAKVFLALDQLKLQRARKTALINLLDHLGVALALCDEDSLCDEARVFREVSRVFALSAYSSCLDWYEREQGEDLSIPTMEEVIDRLGGAQLMVRIRREKTADQRYPAAMSRLRRLIAEIPDGPLGDQLSLFLERAALSKWNGEEPETERLNLLTLHSTKGLEFSRVYVVGTEDSQLPGHPPNSGMKPDEVEEGRRLLYVGMTRTMDRLVLTRVASRGGKPTGGHQFLDEMGLAPASPT